MRTFGFQWHITNRCNLRCAHCYQDEFSDRADPTSDHLKKLADRVLDGLSERQVSLQLTGGEPLLSPCLLDLLEHLQQFGHLNQIDLITNGTIIDQPTLERIRGFPKIGFLKVSLESAAAKINDAVRGPGNFEKVRANLEIFRQVFGKKIVLMSTLARYNLATIEQTASFARENHLEGVIFERFVPLGRGLRMQEQVPTCDDWMLGMASMLRTANLDLDPYALLAYHAFWLWTQPERTDRLQGALCNLGDETMALMPDGTVFPCRRLPLPLGNALGEPFDAILNRLKTFRLPSLHSRLRGRICGLCGVENCAGCRALALAICQDALADDPLCPLVAGKTKDIQTQTKD